MKKLVDQFDLDWSEKENQKNSESLLQMNEERATLLFCIDIMNKHLFEIESMPVRKVREVLDGFAKDLMSSGDDTERILFRFRQFFSSYRIDECAYVDKTFDDFRHIIWDFVDQLSEDFRHEKNEDLEMNKNLDVLKESVEANSIDDLKMETRKFIDSYIEYQTRRDTRKNQRMRSISQNLDVVKQKLTEANDSMRKDHLTGAFNRRCFDEYIREQKSMTTMKGQKLTMIGLDIDHFKKVNDVYGHAIGDFVLVECVKLLEKSFSGEGEFVARVGGEEFFVVLPNCSLAQAQHKAEKALKLIAGEVFVKDDMQISFTVSMGVAEYQVTESLDDWMKRTDQALYKSKTSGRNRVTLALDSTKTNKAA